MKKKQLRTLCILSAVIVVLAVALAVLHYEPAAEVLSPLISCKPGDVESLHYTTRSADLRLVRNNDRWQLSGDPDFPVEETVVEEMLELLCSITPQAVLSDADPEAFGLTQPQCTIQVSSGDAVQQILIGSMNAVTDQLYVQLGDQVYLTDTSLLQAFSGSALDIAAQYEIPKPDDHRWVQIENANGGVLLSCVGSQTGGADGTWYVQLEDGQWVAADSTAAYNYYFLTWDMHWKSTAGYVTEQTQLADYGLDAPQARYTLAYGEETFDLILGADLPDGTTYAMCAGSALVYTMDTLLVSWLNQATAEAVVATNESTSP